MRRGEVATTLTLISLVVMAFGLITGGRTIQTVQNYLSQADEAQYDFEATNEVRYKGEVLKGVRGFTWRNSYLDTLHAEYPGASSRVSGAYEVDGSACNDRLSDCAVRSVWREMNLNNPDHSRFVNTYYPRPGAPLPTAISERGFLNHDTWVELYKLPSTYMITGMFCDATSSSDVRTCKAFCSGSAGWDDSDPATWYCEFGSEKALSRFSDIRISRGGVVTYGWNVLLSSEITPTVTPRVTSTVTPTQRLTSTPSPTKITVQTPTPSVGDVVIPDDDPTATPEPTVAPISTPTPTINRDACSFVFGRVPAAVISSALANPESVPGGDDPENVWLSLRHPSNPYHPIDNTLVFVKNCPSIPPTPTREALPTVPAILPTATPTHTPTPTRRPTSTPAPTITPTPTTSLCPFNVELQLKIKRRDGRVEIFDSITKANLDWYAINNVQRAQLGGAPYAPEDASENMFGFNNGTVPANLEHFSLPAPADEPNPAKRYNLGDKLCTTLYYDSTNYRVVSSEVGRGYRESETVICGLPIECGANFNYGWTVEETTTPTTPNLKVAFLGDQQADPEDKDQLEQKEVMRLIKREGAQMLVLLGDLREWSTPEDVTTWFTMIEEELNKKGDPPFPIVGVPGNHEVDYGYGTYPRSWEEYQSKLAYLSEKAGVECTGDYGMDSVCRFGGLDVFMSGAGVSRRTNNEPLIAGLQDKLSKSNAIWKVCAWHRPRPETQLGSANVERDGRVPWDPFELCREHGAIIANGHEHSYHRGKTLASVLHLTPDAECQSSDGCRDGSQVWVGKGRTFVMVSGLGGNLNRRPQLRCINTSTPARSPGNKIGNAIGDENCAGKTGSDLWSTMYGTLLPASILRGGRMPEFTDPLNEEHYDWPTILRDYVKAENKPQAGAAFITFNVDGDVNKAQGYFMTVKDETKDTFTVLKKDSANPPAELGRVVPDSTPPQEPHVGVHMKVINMSRDIIRSVLLTLCQAGSDTCETAERIIDLEYGETDIVQEYFTTLKGTAVQSAGRYETSCQIVFAEGRKENCEKRVMGGDNSVFYTASASESGRLTMSSETERERADVNGDGVNTALDCAYMVANYGTPRGDADGDGTTNSVDISLCIKWLGADED